jgi:nucleoside-diphosphate-sugar epimerase
VKIAVSGAGGFIGRALCARLAARGDTVVALPRQGEMPLGGVEAIVHLAALAHENAQACERTGDYETLRRVNALGAEHMAREAARASVGRFVFLSSIGVFGEETSGTPFDEDCAPAPRSLYAASKLEAEVRLQRVAGASGLKLAVLRPTLVYGPGNPGNFLRLLRLVHRGLPLPLRAVRNRRNLASIDNVVGAIEALLEPAAPGGLFVACDSEAFSTAQLVERLAEAMGRKARLVSVPPGMLRVAGRVAGRSDLARRLLGSLEASNAKLRTQTRWTPAPADRVLRDTGRWFLEQGHARASG